MGQHSHRAPRLPAGMATRPAGEARQVSGRIWIERGGETFLAWGRVVLLERIREDGSISAAARSMGMGYRHAWELVEAMNRQAPAPLVAKATGGRGGGGARLTPAGERAVAEFWRLVKEFDAWLAGRRLRLGEGPR
jgi:molybdate transport system regulatory protein